MSEFRSWLKIFFPKKYEAEPTFEEIDWKTLQSRLNYSIKDKDPFKEALRHRSHPSCAAPDFLPSNERIEFLGDAIVNFCIGEFVFDTFQDAPEGDLTKMRAIFVSREFLAKIGRKLKIGEFMALGEGEIRSGGRNKESILSNAIEALVGAIYKDGGYDSARKFIETVVLHNYKSKLKSEGINYKGDLLEYIQKKHMPMPKFVIKMADGPDHKKLYTVSVLVGDKTMGTGQGKTKKIAEQEASRLALKKIDVKRKRKSPRGNEKKQSPESARQDDDKKQPRTVNRNARTEHRKTTERSTGSKKDTRAKSPESQHSQKPIESDSPVKGTEPKQTRRRITKRKPGSESVKSRQVKKETNSTAKPKEEKTALPQSETQKPLDTIEKSEAAEVRSQEEKPKARTTGRKPRAYKRKPRRDTAEVREPEKQAASTNKPDKEPQ